MRRWQPLSFALIAAVIAISGCSKKPVAPDVLARVGDREILVSEFATLHAARQRLNPAPLDPKAFLDDMIARETLVQAARKAGLDRDPEVQDAIRNVLAAKLKERELEPKLQAVAVSQDEVRAAYEAGRAEFTVPERAHLAILSLRAPAGRMDAARQRMEIALGQMRQPGIPVDRNFGAISVDFSDDQETRYRGGDLGWVERGHFPPRIEAKVIDAGFALKQQGETSDVIQGEQGVYLVKCLAKQAPAPAPLEKVEPLIRSRLTRAKREQVEAAYLTQLHESVPVETHPEKLPASAPAPGVSSLPKLP